MLTPAYTVGSTAFVPLSRTEELSDVLGIGSLVVVGQGHKVVGNKVVVKVVAVLHCRQRPLKTFVRGAPPVGWEERTSDDTAAGALNGMLQYSGARRQARQICRAGRGARANGRLGFFVAGTGVHVQRTSAVFRARLNHENILGRVSRPPAMY